MKWSKFIKRLVKDGKISNIYGSSSTKTKGLSFHYDALSYSKNFDDGRWIS
ncbi:hypothetical protein LINGRAHAP2_LOCUS30388 [Linum grandiflorum]